MSAKRIARRRTFRYARGALRLTMGAITGLALALAANWLYQVVRKPTELLFPMADSLTKTPSDTWRSYGPLFERHATRTIPAVLLAALAQQEAAGNPLAHTYWRWSAKPSPADWYRPASSSVGLYQMTDPAFEEARHFCVRNHVVVAEGVRQEDGCPTARWVSRVIPSDAIELAAAFLDRHVRATLVGTGRAASILQKERLAAAIHLCGPRIAETYARRGFRFAPDERCGDHDPAEYLARIDSAVADFTRLQRGG